MDNNTGNNIHELPVNDSRYLFYEWPGCLECYTEEGIKLLKDPESKGAEFRLAFRYFLFCAKRDHVKAMEYLCLCYDAGKGTVMDSEKAYYWISKAAAQGSISAMAYKGIMLYEGKGVAQDYDEALGLFREAEKAGSRKAILYMGLCYYHGHGVEKDLQQAKLRLEKANEWFPYICGSYLRNIARGEAE